jgi:hypothetical protein
MRDAYQKAEASSDFLYPVWITKYEESLELLTPPTERRHDGHRVVEFDTPQYLFDVMVSAPTHRKPEWLRTVALRSDGTLFILVFRREQGGLFRKTAAALARFSAR